MKFSLLVIFMFPIVLQAQTGSDGILVAPPKSSAKEMPAENSLASTPNKKVTSKSELAVASAPVKIEPSQNTLTIESEVVAEGANVDAGMSFGIYGAPNLQNYKLAGSGFEGELQSKNGINLGVNALYTRTFDPHGAFLNFDHSSVTLTATTVLTPTNIEMKRDVFQAGYIYQGLMDGDLGLEAGYSYMKQAATLTTPKSLVSSFNAHGFLLGFNYSKELSWKEVSLKVESLVFIPVQLNEEDKTTGEFQKGFSSFTTITLSKKVTRKLSFAVGAKLNVEEFSFDGTSTRGTTNGKLNYNSISFPIEMRYQL